MPAIRRFMKVGKYQLTQSSAGKPTQRFCVLCLLLVGSITGFNTAFAATKIFVQNDTPLELSITNIAVTGDSLSKKAWKKGKIAVATDGREWVLSINRTGKFNWMDPTPRFIEPGKTALFSIELLLQGTDVQAPVQLRQKLTGTGSGSKMWYSIDGANESFEWQQDLSEQQGTFSLGEQIVSFTYRAYKEKKDVNVEYIFSTEK